jgi:hypothetical protein
MIEITAPEGVRKRRTCSALTIEHVIKPMFNGGSAIQAVPLPGYVYHTVTADGQGTFELQYRLLIGIT